MKKIVGNYLKKEQMILIPDKKGLVKIEYSNGVLIVSTMNDNLFKGRKVVTLKEQVEINLLTKIIVLPKGREGWLFSGKVFFRVGMKYFGVSPRGKTENILALC